MVEYYEPGDYGGPGVRKYHAHHPNYYVFDHERFDYVDPTDEPKLWKEYQENRLHPLHPGGGEPVYWKTRFSQYSQYKRPVRRNVLRGFNRYVKHVYED